MGLRVFVQENTPHRHLWSVKMEVENLRIGSNGKGPTREEAFASAYCELVERISIGMLCGVNLAPYRQLYGPAHRNIINVEQFRYMDGYRWAHQDALPNPVRVEDFLAGQRFTRGQLESLKMNSEFLRHWVPGYSLIYNREVQVPILFTKWISATNGIASGNTMEEAIVHACCEIYERDALIKYLRHMVPSQAKDVKPETINDERIQNILRWFKDNKINVAIKDIGYGVYPVYAILTFNHNMEKSQFGYNIIKSGSAFDTKDALLRCFTERMQGSTFEKEARLEPDERIMPNDRYMPILFTGLCPFSLESYRNSTEKVDFHDWSLTDTKVEVEKCVEIAKKLNTDLIVVNHTHPVFNLPTVRVVMPCVSDFMKWWDPTKLTLDFVGNLQPEEDVYEHELIKLLKTFDTTSSHASSAKNRHRRDV